MPQPPDEGGADEQQTAEIRARQEQVLEAGAASIVDEVESELHEGEDAVTTPRHDMPDV